MKTKIFGFATYMILSFLNVYAQDGIEIRLNGVGPDISGTAYTTDLYAASPDLNGGVFEVHFDVNNNTISDQQWRITRKKINVPLSWTDQICWPPSCYPANGDVYTTPNSGLNPAPTILNDKTIIILNANAPNPPTTGTLTINISGTEYVLLFDTDLQTTVDNFINNEGATILASHNLTLSNSGTNLVFSGTNPLPSIEVTNTTGDLNWYFPNELKPRITPDPATASSAHYRYYITSITGANLDSIDVVLNYVLAVTNLKQAPTISVSPNPASENVNVTLGTTENSSIRVVDVLGNTVYAETITNGQKTINVEDFKNGVYFIMVEGPGIKINRKLIVRH